MTKRAGRMIDHPTGYQAFVPNPLPPEISWDNSMINALSDADRLLGNLAGEGGRLPNPHIFVRSFITREAVLSSRIEGTRASISDVFAAEAGAVVSDNDVADLQEVNNYIVALDYGISRLALLPLSLRLIREIHEKLMVNVRGGHATPGHFRTSQNWIGPAGCTLSTATYVPPSPEYLMACLGDLELFMHSTTLPLLVQIALIHYQFEAIHPFLDGNGRVGRLLITLFLTARKALPTPLLYLSAFFEATRREYYARLLAVSKEGDWHGWLSYFLNGVARQAEDALSRSQRINQLLTQWREQTAGLAGGVAFQLIDQIAANPFLTATRAAHNIGSSFATVQRALGKLEELGIIAEVSGNKRGRLYCARQLVAILEEPARVSAG